MKTLSLDDFLQSSGTSQETWKRSGLDWSELTAIAADHELNKGTLLHTAEFCAKVIQGFEGVHSVRWRIKDTLHLLEKIVRKRGEGADKYSSITRENYHQVVTDLIGIPVSGATPSVKLCLNPIAQESTPAAIKSPRIRSSGSTCAAATEKVSPSRSS